MRAPARRRTRGQPLADHRHLGARLFQGDVPAQQGDGIHVVVRHLRGGRPRVERRPEQGAGRLVESRRHDAHDRVRPAAELDDPTDDIRRTAQAFVPEAPANDGHVALVFGEEPAEDRAGAEHTEEVALHGRPDDAHGITGSDQHVVAVVDEGGGFETPRRQRLDGRRPRGNDVVVAVGQPHHRHHDALGGRVGEGLEQRGPDQAEHRYRRAEPQRQRRHGGRGESGERRSDRTAERSATGIRQSTAGRQASEVPRARPATFTRGRWRGAPRPARLL